MDDYTRANLAHWDELVPLHCDSAFYDLEGFKRGACSLRPVEVAEMGAVEGKSLLHLQCHFGMDTLSWARRGARVTGVDFSGEAIRLARNLSEELQIPAAFVESDLYALRETLKGSWEIVYTGGGALCWLRDIREWARIVAHFLQPGGFLYLREIHPAGLIFDDERQDGELVARYPYFGTGEPERWEDEQSYAAGPAPRKHLVTYEWPHTLGQVVTAVCEAGLRLEYLHEFPDQCFGQLAAMQRRDDGTYYVPGKENAAPFQFSLKATKV